MHIHRKRKFCPQVINKLWINYVNRISYPLLLISLWIKGRLIIHRDVQKIADAVDKIRNAKNLRICLTNRGFLNIIEAMFSNIYMIDNYNKDTNWNKFGSVKRRCRKYEDDISAEKEIQIQGSRIPGKNEHSRRKKSFSCQKSKRKKSIVSIGRRYVAFFVTVRNFPGSYTFLQLFWIFLKRKNVWFFQNL